ncbi:MAG: PH domain-containing protein [Salibacteraceae bacterium]|jgi:putative membrane protein|nr:PH domain-containing protein [Salibacteraceae bacterium]MDP4686471.1 PH domain-containing protein [Salibacteraceae bacterium]MDP4763141.1 PH domain-containing protein [Salibacteraceae bacterium]MDP4844822.1 PH domain-containing protein [Salibacteraceae bacterium]MDP4933559.1 PH domain-containing protein [Salibacteraceae bacterium]
MATENKIILKAAFNPAIKNYILVVGSFFLIITFFGILLLPFWLLGVGQFGSKRYFNSLQCELTSRHLRFKKGAFFKVEKTIPLENIQDLTFIDNPFLRWFDLRILKVETASGNNPHGSDMKLIGIMDTENFKEEVLEQRERIVSAKSSNAPQSSSDDQNLMTMLSEIKTVLEEIRDKK